MIVSNICIWNYKYMNEKHVYVYIYINVKLVRLHNSI